jgi:hypothetical protein
MRMRWSPVVLAVALLAMSAPTLGDHAPRRLGVSSPEIAEPVQPAGDPGRAVLDVRIPCQEDERATVWSQAVPVASEPFVEPATAHVENSSTQVCHDRNDTLEVGVPVEIDVTTDAPAFQPTGVAYDVHVQKNHTNGTTTELGPVGANVTLTPGYFNLYNARMETKIVEAGPDEGVTFPIVIENHSNGMTEFAFELASQPASGFQPVLPSKIVLESEATGGTRTSETVNFTVFTPFHNGYVSETASMALEIHSAYAADPSLEGESAQVSALTKVSGFYLPSLAPLVVVALIGCAAGLRGRS